MRVAVFSDVHGNAIGLDAVLTDIEAAGGVDAHWFVGDAAALGFDPVGSVERIAALPNLTAVRGNTDRLTISDDPEANATFVKLAADDPEAAVRTFTIVRNFDWTRGAITSAGLFAWFAGLPLEARIELPDGTRVLLVHAAPGTDEGAGITTGQSDEELGALLKGIDADLIFVGHTHKPLDRTVDGVRVVNLGSVSNPGTEDQRAMWTLLVSDESGYQLERRFVDYDIPAVLERLDEVHHPAGAYIRSFFDSSKRAGR